MADPAGFAALVERAMEIAGLRERDAEAPVERLQPMLRVLAGGAKR